MGTSFVPAGLSIAYRNQIDITPRTLCLFLRVAPERTLKAGGLIIGPYIELLPMGGALGLQRLFHLRWLPGGLRSGT
jgi:hypothetical protein